jgi:hypothetical protein
VSEEGTIESVHRAMASTVLWMSLLSLILLFTALDSMGLLSSPFAILLLGITFGGSAYLYHGFSKRQPWALGPTKLLWLFLMSMCALFGLIDVLSALNGSIISGLLAIMLFYVVYTMGKRFKNFSNPMFVSWYFGSAAGGMHSLSLLENEVMASCPNCLSILAVKPFELTADELCPNCNCRLISEETVAKFSEEE